MFTQKKQSGYGVHIHKLKKMQTFAIVLFVVLLVTAPILFISKFQNRLGNEKKELLRLWDAGEYQNVYELSKNALNSKPLDYFLLTINGFSAYQLGISQINSINTVFYMDECIQTLRKALLLKESQTDGRVYYVLGKAYSYKGDEYSDLAIKYLEIAQELNYSANDIYEYLGLAYAASGDYRGSVEAFTQALALGDFISDALLISIARSYIALGENDIAKAYLVRCIDVSQDTKSAITAKLLLADVFIKLDDHLNAEELYLSILNDSGENAEVHYMLGELYNQLGDSTRARYEWRMAYRIDPAHVKARIRLNI